MMFRQLKVGERLQPFTGTTGQGQAAMLVIAVVDDLRPLRSFLSVAAFPFSPPLPGENRPVLMVAGASMHAVRSASNGRRAVRF